MYLVQKSYNLETSNFENVSARHSHDTTKNKIYYVLTVNIFEKHILLYYMFT